MLSLQTETLICKLLLTIIEGEKNVEIIRMVIADQADFDPYSLFKNLDSDNTDTISEKNLESFFRSESIDYLPEEVRQIISHYDADGDRALNLNEFLNLIIPRQKTQLIKETIDKAHGSSHNKSKPVSFEVEYTLGKIFTEELKLIRNIQVINSELSLRYDFNTVTLFSALDEAQKGTVSLESFEAFLLRNGLEMQKSELEALFNRFDITKKSEITQNHLRIIVTNEDIVTATIAGEIQEKGYDLNQENTNIQPKAANYSRGVMSSPRRKKMEQSKPLESKFRQIYYSPNKNKVEKEYKTLYPNSFIYNSPKENKTDVIGYISPKREHPVVKKTIEIAERLSPKKKHLDSGFSDSPSFTDTRRDIFFTYLKTLFEKENEIERIKYDLALSSDFNLPEYFQIFEVDKKGYFNDIEFISGCNYLELYPTEDEMRLVFKRFTNGGEILFRYTDFCEMVFPIDGDYYNMMKGRVPQERGDSRDDYRRLETKHLFKRLLKKIIECEAEMENWRIDLENSVGFSVREVFNRIDVLGNGSLSKQDFMDFFDKSQFVYMKRDIDLLFYRFDVDGDGKISYSEFGGELYPKIS